MLLVYGADPEAEADGSAPSAAGPESAAETEIETEADPGRLPWAEQLAGLGIAMHDGAVLRDAVVATTVRAHGSDVVLSDGPCAEAGEQVIAYQVIEFADLDAAIEAAARHPALGGGRAVEVRPIAEE